MKYELFCFHVPYPHHRVTIGIVGYGSQAESNHSHPLKKYPEKVPERAMVRGMTLSKELLEGISEAGCWDVDWMVGFFGLRRSLAICTLSV